MQPFNENIWHGSTILSVRKGKQVVIAADGQLTEGVLILKSNVQKIRRLKDSNVIAGFTGATAHAVILFEKLEQLVMQHPHQLLHASVDLIKFWKKELHTSQARDMMIVVNASHTFVITGEGNVFEKEDGIIGIGSGGPFALAAAKALFDQEDLSAYQIVEKALKVTAEICIYTNQVIAIEEIQGD